MTLLKQRLFSFLNDNNKDSILALVEKYENVRPMEGIHLLRNNFESLKPVTQHRIRELLNRQGRKTKVNSQSSESIYSTPTSSSCKSIHDYTFTK